MLAQKLVNDYVAQPEQRTKMMASLAKVDLLIIDEFGYLPYDVQAGPLFYQLISDRYQKKATIITSNKSLRAWVDVLHDVSLVGALIDRLMDRGEVFYLRGDSYRLRGKEKYLEESVASSALSSA